MCKLFITGEYSSIEKKLKNNEYESFEEYIDDLRMFQNYILENGPLGPHRNVIMLQHLLKYLEDASELFVKQLGYENQVQTTLKEELQKKLEA